jgi:alpha-1,6-mannosyltransferase
MLATMKRLLSPVGGAQTPVPASEPSLRRYAVAGLVAAAAVVAGAVSGGSSFVSHLPGAWLFGTPGGPLGFVSPSTKDPPAISILAVYGGLAALAGVWWRLLRALHARPGVPVGQALRVLAVWAVPFLLGPPLFSRDVYSYAGQGALVSFHIDPYHYGPGVLGASRFNLLAGPLWANSPSPYGPTFLSLDGLVTRLSGHQILVDILLLRLLALAGVALLATGLPTLARHVGRDPAAAVVLGAGSPLVLTTLVGGAHNDALMAGLLVAGLAAWRRFGPVPGIVLCALAAGVKAPAALGVVAIGWNWDPGPALLRRRIVRTLEAGAVALGTLATVSAVTGVGWGWTHTLGTPDKISTGVTPVDAAARVLAGGLHLVGVSSPTSSVRLAVAVAGLAVAGLVGTWLLWNSPRLGDLRALGLSLLVLALLGPVLWGWYLTWGLAVLAPVARGLLRRVLVWLAIGEAFIGVSSVQAMFHALGREGPLAVLMVVLGVGAAALGAVTCRYEVPAGRVRFRRARPRPAVATVSGNGPPAS